MSDTTYFKRCTDCNRVVPEAGGWPWSWRKFRRVCRACKDPGYAATLDFAERIKKYPVTGRSLTFPFTQGEP